MDQTQTNPCEEKCVLIGRGTLAGYGGTPTMRALPGGALLFAPQDHFINFCIFLENNTQQNHNDNGAPQAGGRRCRCDFVARGFHLKIKKQKRTHQKSECSNIIGRGVVGIQVAGAKNLND